MHTTGMLLRSSSNPLLDCLLAAPSSHTELSPDTKFHECSAAEAHAPFGFALHTCRGGTHMPPSCVPHMHLDSLVTPPGWASCSASPANGRLPCPSNCIRKVQSENDLCSLVSGELVMSARIAANALLQDEDCTRGSVFEFHRSCSYPPHLKKGRAPQPLSRRRSLGSLPSELPSVFFNGDSAGNDLSILEEVEVSPSCSSPASEEDGVFYKIALPVGEAIELENNADVVHEEGKLSTALFEKAGLQGKLGKGDGLSRPSTGLSQVGMIASSSGRQEAHVTLGQGSSVNAMAWKGSDSTGLMLVRGVCDPSSPLKYGYRGDDMDMAYNGGDGGRGARPPAITGGGGGGDARGRGEDPSDIADQRYESVLQKDPGNPLFLRNYAQYLAEVKHDYRKAEEFFERAILANPSDGELLGQYAKMLWEVKHDVERATTYFERAVQAAPDNSYVMAAYASFLWSSEEEEEQESKESCPSNFPASFPSLVSAGLA